MTEEKKNALKQAGLTDEQIKLMELQETTSNNNDKLTKSFIDKLYTPAYKPSVYASKIKQNFTINIKSYAFESVNTDSSIKNIMSKTGNIPSIPTMEELQKDGKTAYNIIINGSIMTENDTEPQEVERFVLSMNNLKALTGFNSIDNTYDSTNDVYNIKSITIDNKLKRVTFSKIDM